MVDGEVGKALRKERCFCEGHSLCRPASSPRSPRPNPNALTGIVLLTGTPEAD